MFSRLGLRSRMTVSYVVVSAAAVLVVEAVLLAIMVPRLRAANDSLEQTQQRVVEAHIRSLQAKAESLALRTAVRTSSEANRAVTQRPKMSDETILTSTAAASIGAALDKSPDRKPGLGLSSPESVLVLVLATRDGRVIASNPPGSFARDSQLPFKTSGASADSSVTEVNGQRFGWATAPVEVTDPVGGKSRVIGIVGAIVPSPDGDGAKLGGPTVAEDSASKPRNPEDVAVVEAGIDSLILPAAIILVLLLPVGALFGLLSTGRLIRRIRKLAESTSAMANGDLKARIPVSTGDEVGQLEHAFNSMAERLDAALQAERETAGSEGRRSERNRIARELHDSITQDLFSAGMLAGGLRRALPADSELRSQAESLESSLGRTMREMRALLLELRPIALEDAGLAAALDELCRAYQARLGISISSRVTPLRLDASVEHAVLRVVQEALGNAVRHGKPNTIELRVVDVDGDRIAVTVQDNGRGFDPQQAVRGHSLGLALMRERVNELGGTFEVVSALERGTMVKVLLPVGGA